MFPHFIPGCKKSSEKYPKKLFPLFYPPTRKLSPKNRGKSLNCPPNGTKEIGNMYVFKYLPLQQRRKRDCFALYSVGLHHHRRFGVETPDPGTVSCKKSGNCQNKIDI
jgi:hypothetical protein